MPACPGCGVDNPERARFCLECGRSLAPGPSDARGSRRTVTILFSDIVGSTALGELLDPEAVHIVMSSYFDEMQAVIERHGGTVEKFIGDAIMAVFGLPVLHEDDALRAVRAAVGMNEALAALNARLERERGVTIAVRTGLNTGEVLAGDASARQTLVTGDAVNTAARLEQAAGAGEILLGATTWSLVRDTVTVEPRPAIPLKGKAEPVPAFLLRSVGTGAVRPDRADGPLVGRDGELDRLRERFAAVVDRRRPAVVTVIGQAGVGKSRLVAEFVAGLGDRATVLKGRCLSYGDGITYWPIRGVLHAAAGIRDEDPPGEGLRKLELLVHDDPDGPIWPLAWRAPSASATIRTRRTSCSGRSAGRWPTSPRPDPWCSSWRISSGRSRPSSSSSSTSSGRRAACPCCWCVPLGRSSWTSRPAGSATDRMPRPSSSRGCPRRR